LRITFLEPFRRRCRGLETEQQAAVLEALLQLDTAFAQPHEHRGLGLRKLHPAGVWEIRIGLDLRVVFRLKGDEIICSLLGGHDEVQRLLRSL
jgi:mRNA-degrading endonuclease YafQ of YafQ-DinJ toxin-antitoxin module